MAQNKKIGLNRRYDINQKLQISNTIVILLFSIELTSYLKSLVAQSILESFLFIIVIICMVAYGIKKKPSYNITNPFWFSLFVYLFLLFIRLLDDFILPGKGFFLYQTPITVLVFFICPIVIPAFFFARYRFIFNLDRTILFLSVILACCIGKSIIDILSGNALINNDGRFDTAIFSIALGQYSVSLTLLGGYLFLQHNTKINILWGGLCCVIGVIGIAFSGSRGPFVALGACILFYIASRLKHISMMVIIILLIIIFWNIIGEFMMNVNEYMKNCGYNSLDRVVNSIFSDDGVSNHSSGRDILYKEAIELFLKEPLFGYSYLIPGKIYVHNIIIEQYMATGIIGGTIFIFINIYALLTGFKLMRRNRQFAIIPILFLQYFIYGCLSITILALYPYWIMLYLIINANDNHQLYEQQSKKNIGFYNNTDF